MNKVLVYPVIKSPLNPYWTLKQQLFRERVCALMILHRRTHSAKRIHIMMTWRANGLTIMAAYMFPVPAIAQRTRPPPSTPIHACVVWYTHTHIQTTSVQSLFSLCSQCVCACVRAHANWPDACCVLHARAQKTAAVCGLEIHHKDTHTRTHSHNNEPSS